MTHKDLVQIETNLKITLPNAYRDLMLARADELKEYKCFDGDFSSFFLDPQRIIRANKMERPKDSGTGYTFPQWWKTFVLVGTNGGGDYYCVRLDNKPGVWMIGSDCGDEPTLMARSLKAFVDKRVKEHKEEQARSAKRQGLIQEEETEELRAATQTENPKAKQWVAGESPYLMFQYLDTLGRKVSPRKLRLFGIACCQRIASLTADKECVVAVRLAEEMVSGAASTEEVAQLRSRMKNKYLALVEGKEKSAAGLWCVGAAKNLLQDDKDYLSDAPIYAGDADLQRVWNSANSASPDVMVEHQAQSDLLREVLGNPFHPVPFNPLWRTTDAVALARTMYENREFDRMPVLADALHAAGCNEQRILKHCRRREGHVRGCWVLDLILQTEPEAKEEEITWDFKWEHPRIDAGELKRRLQDFGAGMRRERIGNSDPLAFADWLEKKGDPVWAEYVRVRCALDGKSPRDDYPEFLEQCLELAAAMKLGRAEFEGFYFSGYRFAHDEWWGDETDDMEKGLPALVNAVKPGRGPGPAADLIKRIEALVSNTPVRGVDFQEHYPTEMAEILASEGAKELRWLAFSNRHDKDQTGPVIQALVNSRLVQNLERLRIGDGITSDGDALTLAEAQFKRLRRLDLPAYCGISCTAQAVTRLMAAPWFRNLEQLQTDFSEECCETAMHHLADLASLHSLALSKLSDRQILAIGRAGKFPALRRIMISGANLTGKFREAFCQLKATRLIELWLQNSKAKAADIRALVASPLFEKLRVLTFAGPRLDEVSLEAVAESACAPELRILRLHCGDSDLIGSFRSLGRTPLTEPGIFPSLTTLQIEWPYAKNANKDTAVFLKNLALPKLRQLTLKDIYFDDECAQALASNPTFANLSRLWVEQLHDAPSRLSASVAKALFRSTNMQELVELQFHRIALGTALEILEDESVIPQLGHGAFWGSEAPDQTIELLKTKRRNIYVRN